MKVNQETSFKLMANCIPVKGANRSTICDLQRNDVQLIPNDLFNILKEKEGKTLATIKKEYDNKYDEIIDDYFQFLLEKEFIFFTSTPSLFPKLPLTWDEPNSITNAILDRSKESTYDIYKALKELNNVRCKHIEIRYFTNTALSEIENIANYLNDLQSSIVSIDVLMPYKEENSTEKLQSILQSRPRISLLTIYNAPKEKVIPPKIKGSKRGYIIYSKKNIKNQNCCGVIDTKLFSLNIKTFTESQQHNSCLNRKTSIDIHGNIKNCPSMAKSYGSITKTSIADAIKDTSYKKYWTINKDQIDVCRDCEFRHICTDCRAYTEDPNNIHSKPLKCGYDPYTNEWSDWATNPLKKKAIGFYQLKGVGHV